MKIDKYDKRSFIDNIKPLLKARGYKKKGQYWFAEGEKYYYCINVQGSQWDTNNYYCNIGMAEKISGKTTYYYLEWLWCHRCEDMHKNDLNLKPEDLLKEINRYFADFLTDQDMECFLDRRKGIKLKTGRWLL